MFNIRKFMNNDVVLWWAWKFLRITVYETVFSWQFLAVVGLTVMFYLFISFRREKTLPANPLKMFFKFKGLDFLFGVAAIIVGMIVIASLSLSVSAHAVSFAEAQSKGCLQANEKEEVFVFIVPEGCVGDKLLFNSVALDKHESESVFQSVKSAEKH